MRRTSLIVLGLMGGGVLLTATGASADCFDPPQNNPPDATDACGRTSGASASHGGRPVELMGNELITRGGFGGGGKHGT